MNGIFVRVASVLSTHGLDEGRVFLQIPWLVISDSDVSQRSFYGALLLATGQLRCQQYSQGIQCS